MTGREQTEIERKYDVEALSRIPDLTGIDGVATAVAGEPFSLTAVYYDTADHDLARRRIVLRRREGGGDAGWHLKKPADEGRTEVHWPLDAGDTDTGDTQSPADGPIPAEVLEPIRAIVRDRPLTPLARVGTVRTTVRLLGADGAALAEIADDEVSASDVRGGTYRKWREWEAELLDDAPDTEKKRTRLLDSIEQTLLTAGARPSTSVAKIARAMGVDSLLALPAAPVLPGLLPAHALQDPESVAVIVVGALRQLTGTLLDDDPRARADAPAAVHRMRTTVRRLRSVLAVYSRLFEKRAVAELRFELKQLGVELGRARDAEVRGGRMAAELSGVAPHPIDDAEIRLVGGARRDYAEELERVRGYLLSTRYYRLLDTLEAFVAWPPLAEKADRAATAEIRRDLTKAVAAVAHATDAVPDAGAQEAALHEVRKAARRLRYAAEAVALADPVAPDAPVPAKKAGKKASKKAGKKAKTQRAAAAARLARRRRRYHDIARTAKPLVKRLGDRHDRLLYIEELEQAAQAAHEDGENTLVYGLLVARSERLDDTVDVVLAEARRSLRELERLTRKL
jgi:inorganic triphosphatase YgiF